MGRAFTEQENINNIELLMLTGRKLAAQRGFKKSSVDEIVRLCSISKGQFYRYFNSKEEFYFKVRMRVKRELEEMTLRELDSVQPVTQEFLAQCFYNHLCECLTKENKIFFDYIELKYLFEKVPDELKKESLDNEINEVVHIVSYIDNSVILTEKQYRLIVSILKSVAVIAGNAQIVASENADVLLKFHSRAVAELFFEYVENAKNSSSQIGSN
ncbi:MAG: TetR/AcrR family transcriptional regulator [Oscillospiraceae bacterium]|nr:TetR/AcrR family transcriptional regulator [Oscillospiraceae bacterium]